MRIAIDTQATFGRKTGIGQYAAHLIAALQRVAPDHGYLSIDQGRDLVMRTDQRVRWQQWELPRRARAARPDVLHVPGFDAPVRKPCPVVFTVHDLIGRLFPENLPPVSRFYWARWLPFTVRFADAVIADSEATRRDIQRLLKVPAERLHVVPLGVDPGFRPQAAERIAACREQYKLPEEYILYLGTLEPRKGIDTLVDAFARITDDYPHQLVLAGKPGWYCERLFEQVSAQRLERRIRFLDYVPDDDRPALYAAATVFVFPSRYEGFGLPVLEAMACGTPVVCSDTASLPEVAGSAARLVPPDQVPALAEALAALLASSALRTDLRTRGLARAQEFSWDKTAWATLDVYRTVVRR